MKCARCSGELKPSTLRELGLVYNSFTCTKCQGIWIAPEKLQDMEGTVDQRFFEIRKVPSKSDQHAVLRCPQCEGGIAMDKLVSRRDESVVIDVCPKCKNVWLDKGEREAIEQDSLFALVKDFFATR
jgi:Zn-finger nucleic acid-binding protein